MTLFKAARIADWATRALTLLTAALLVLSFIAATGAMVLADWELFMMAVRTFGTMLVAFAVLVLALAIRDGITRRIQRLNQARTGSPWAAAR